MKVLAVLFALLAMSGCSLFGPDGGSGEAGLVLDLEEREHLFLPSLDATLRFVEKTDDSRCPLDGLCIWAGEATVLLTVAPAGQPPLSFTITSSGAGGEGIDEDGHVYRDVAGLRFTMLDLRPYPDSRIAYDKPSVVTLRVQRLS